MKKRRARVLLHRMLFFTLWGGLVTAGSPPAATTGTAIEPTAAAATPRAANLVRNGGFEQGDKSPEGWLFRYPRVDRSQLTDIPVLDNLTVFWDTKASTTGKCIRMDTDVNQKEVHRRMEELIAGPLAPPWPKTPTRPPKYDTAAGLEGVGLWSDPIAVEKGRIYRMSVDVKGQMTGIFFPKMFVHGFGMTKDAKGRTIKGELYNTYVSCRVAGAGWNHFTQTFCPTDPTAGVTEIRAKIYAYWPPGLYYWDNVAVTEAPEAEAAAVRAAMAKQKEATAKKPPGPTPRKRKPGEPFVVEQEEPLVLPE